MGSEIVTALTATATDVTGDMTGVLTAALGVFALSWGIRKVIRFFKAASN